MSQTWVFRLFVSDKADRDRTALKYLQEICDEHLCGKYGIEVVNIDTHPEEAARFRIFTSPALLRIYPGPVKKFAGDFSDYEKVLLALGLKQEVRSEVRLFSRWLSKAEAA